MKKSTIRDVALLAGVSTATVSRVFNGTSRSSREIKEKVAAAIAELDYRPNPAMAAIASRHFHISPKSETTAVALLTAADVDGLENSGPCFPEFEKFAAELGYSVSKMAVRPGTSPRELGKTLYHRGIAGILIDDGCVGQKFLDTFDWTPFSVVSIDSRIAQPFDTIRRAVFDDTRTACGMVRLRGFQRSGFVIVGDTRKASAPDETEAVASESHHSSKQGGLPPYFCVESAPERPPKSFTRWLESQHPDVILSRSLQPLRWLQAAKVRVPRDIAFVALRIDVLEPDTPAGMRASKDTFLAAAMERLDQLFRKGIQGLSECPRQILLKSRWQEGWTFPAHRPGNRR